MNRKLALLLFASLSLSLSACTQQVFGNKTARFIPVKPLKEIKTTLTVQKNWQVKTGSAMGENKVHPFIDAQAIYTAGSSNASAYRKSNGSQLWKVNIGEVISAGINGHANIAQSQQIFLGTSNGNAISLDAKTGKILWIERLSSEIVSVSPSNNGRVAFRTIDGKISGLSSSTGELIWQRSQRSPALTIMGASVPILVGPYVISGFDNGKVAAYSLQSGKPIWEITLALPRGRTELERIIDIDGKITPLGTALFASSLNGSAAGINLANIGTVWLKPFSTATGLSVNPEGIYSSDDKGNVWRLNPQTGEPLWKMDDLQRYQPTLPVLVNSTLVMGDKKGNIHWVNAIDGQFVARIKGDPRGYSVEPEVVGNTVYAIGKSGVLSKITKQ